MREPLSAHGDSRLLAAREYHSLEEVRRRIAPRLGDAVPSLFAAPEWFEALHRHCLSETPARVVMAAQGRAEAWLFLHDGDRRRSSALANWYSFAWSPLFLGDPGAALQAQLLEAIATHLLKKRAQIDLFPLEDGVPMLAALRKAGWFAVARTMGRRHVLDVGGRDFATYWAARPGRLKELVRRKGRRSPFDLTVHHAFDDRLWQDYAQVHAQSWKEAEPGGGLALLQDIAEREGRAGRLRLGFARRGDQAVATQLWTIDGGTALIHKLCHDRAFDAHSPGTLLSHAMFAHVIDRDRVARIDYGTGDNAYKNDWMETRIPLHRIDAFNPRAASAWLPAARTAISALVG